MVPPPRPSIGRSGILRGQPVTRDLTMATGPPQGWLGSSPPKPLQPKANLWQRVLGLPRTRRPTTRPRGDPKNASRAAKSRNEVLDDMMQRSRSMPNGFSDDVVARDFVCTGPIKSTDSLMTSGPYNATGPITMTAVGSMNSVASVGVVAHTDSSLAGQQTLTAHPSVTAASTVAGHSNVTIRPTSHGHPVSNVDKLFSSAMNFGGATDIAGHSTYHGRSASNAVQTSTSVMCLADRSTLNDSSSFHGRSASNDPSSSNDEITSAGQHYSTGPSTSVGVKTSTSAMSLAIPPTLHSRLASNGFNTSTGTTSLADPFVDGPSKSHGHSVCNAVHTSITTTSLVDPFATGPPKYYGRSTSNVVKPSASKMSLADPTAFAVTSIFSSAKISHAKMPSLITKLSSGPKHFIGTKLSTRSTKLAAPSASIDTTSPAPIFAETDTYGILKRFRKTPRIFPGHRAYNFDGTDPWYKPLGWLTRPGDFQIQWIPVEDCLDGVSEYDENGQPIYDYGEDSDWLGAKPAALADDEEDLDHDRRMAWAQLDWEQKDVIVRRRLGYKAKPIPPKYIPSPPSCPEKDPNLLEGRVFGSGRHVQWNGGIGEEHVRCYYVAKSEGNTYPWQTWKVLWRPGFAETEADAKAYEKRFRAEREVTIKKDLESWIALWHERQDPERFDWENGTDEEILARLEARNEKCRVEARKRKEEKIALLKSHGEYVPSPPPKVKPLPFEWVRPHSPEVEIHNWQGPWNHPDDKVPTIASTLNIEPYVRRPSRRELEDKQRKEDLEYIHGRYKPIASGPRATMSERGRRGRSDGAEWDPALCTNAKLAAKHSARFASGEEIKEPTASSKFANFFNLHRKSSVSVLSKIFAAPPASKSTSNLMSSDQRDKSKASFSFAGTKEAPREYILTPLSQLLEQSFVDLQSLKLIHAAQSTGIDTPGLSAANGGQKLVGKDGTIIDFAAVESNLEEFQLYYHNYIKLGGRNEYGIYDGSPIDEVYLVAMMNTRSEVTKGRMGTAEGVPMTRVADCGL